MYKKEQYNQKIWYNIAVEILMDLVDLNWRHESLNNNHQRRDPYGSRGSKSTVGDMTIDDFMSRSLWISWI